MTPRVPAALLAVGICCGVVTASATAAPPAGATARCKDRTYSFAEHHSGSCSSHGGVAVFFDTVTRGSGNAGAVQVGTTVLLARRTKTSHCKLGPNPDRACSPGAYYSRLTKAVLCSPSFHTSSVRNVPVSEKHAVEVEYGLAPRSYGRSLEIDHIVSLELGGSNDIANLFPEKASANPGYGVKDKLENRVHKLVCLGAMTLRDAQHQIASNWQALYRHVFRTPPVA